MPAVSGSPTQVRTSATTAADLAGTPDDAFNEGDFACVTSLWPNSTFRLCRTPLGAAPDNVNTIDTFSGNGYWEVFGAGGGLLVFATIGLLAAYNDAALPDGAIVYVQSVRSYFHKLIQADPGTADGITNVENPTNTATWYRDPDASPSWVSVGTTWVIDSTNGDDEALGNAPGTALATHDEFMRRLGQNQLTQDLEVTFIDGFLGDFEHTMLPGQQNGFLVVYRGTPLVDLTPVYTDTFASFTAISRAGTGQRTNFLSTLDGPTWATYVGKLIVVTVAADPGALGAYAWVQDIQMGDDATVFTTPFTDGTALVDPADGDTYIIVDPTVAEFETFFVAIKETPNDVGSVQFHDLALGLGRASNISEGQAGFLACRFDGGYSVTGEGSAYNHACRFTSDIEVYDSGQVTIEASFIDGTTGNSMAVLVDSPNAQASILSDSILSGDDANLQITQGLLTLTDFGAFDTIIEIASMYSGARGIVRGYLYGENNDAHFFALGSATRVISENATFLATTTLPNVFFGGIITQNWGGLPFIANAAVTDSQAAWLDNV